MESKRVWIAFFSQTGNELNEVSKRLGRYPDRVYTSNWPNRTNEELRKAMGYDKFWTFSYNRSISDRQHRDAFSSFPPECLVTLHGWLRIVPGDLCEKFEIYNGHPGLIDTYPILKGKDPQKKAWDLMLPKIGCVIHKVTAGIDEGEIISRDSLLNTYKSQDEVIMKLHDLSVELWINFLRGKLCV